MEVKVASSAGLFGDTVARDGMLLPRSRGGMREVLSQRDGFLRV